MAEQYQVVGALADFTVVDDEGNTQKVTFYKGSPVPQGVPQPEIEHNLSVKLIAKMGSPEEAIPAMVGPVGTETQRAPEGNALATPVDRVMAPAPSSPQVATEEQISAGTVVATEQATADSQQQDATAARRAAAQEKLTALGGEAPDGRAGKDVHVEYLTSKGLSYDELVKLDKPELVEMTKQESQKS